MAVTVVGDANCPHCGKRITIHVSNLIDARVDEEEDGLGAFPGVVTNSTLEKSQ